MTMTTRLDIFSDPVCPWCHIGMANLERALAEAPGHPFALSWHPFRLNPDIPAGGIDRRAYLAARFPDAAQREAIGTRLREAIGAAGLSFDPDRPALLPDTLDAHRLIHWAGIEGCQREVVAALFRAYWDEGRDIGEGSTLADIAGACAMDRAAVLRLLAGDADRDTVATLDAEAHRRGITGVPAFVIGQKYLVSGAQPAALWTGVIADLARQA